MTILQTFLITGIAIFCTACVSGKNSDTNEFLVNNKQQSTLQKKQEDIRRFEGTWSLAAINGNPITQKQLKQRPFFTITGMNISGFDGCNQFSGRIDESANIAATRMGCPPETLKIPLDLDNLLAHLQTGTLSGDTLTIPAQNRFPASVFKRSK